MVDAVIAAATGETPDPAILHSHQSKIFANWPNALFEGAAKLIQPEYISLIQSAHDFEELIGVVSLVARRVTGLSDLWTYDTALRVSWYLSVGKRTKPTAKNVRPRKWVYVHSGAERGRKKLNPIPTRFSHGMGPYYVPKNNFLPPINGMSAWDIENYLCMFKRLFP